MCKELSSNCVYHTTSHGIPLFDIDIFLFFPQTLLTSETARIKDENGKTVLLLAAETGIITNLHFVVYIYCAYYLF